MELWSHDASLIYSSAFRPSSDDWMFAASQFKLLCLKSGFDFETNLEKLSMSLDAEDVISSSDMRHSVCPN